MIGGLLARLVDHLRGGEETDDARFVPSPLDESVRYAHGGSGSEIEREMGDIEEEARRLEDAPGE